MFLFHRFHVRAALGVAVLATLSLGAPASAAIVMATVPVGDPGNAADSTGYGAVSYAYNIGKYEVTAGQYTSFLNAVARTDSYGLYIAAMWENSIGCKIQQIGSPGSYTYTVASDYANRPVNDVSFWDACRFANWLQNGQPTGAQGPGTTETGAYTLTSGGMANNTITRNAGTTWAITSEDEWYKAAYYKGGGANAGYWLYPTSSNTAPSSVGADGYTDPGNHANFALNGTTFTIGPPYYRTNVGEFENSASPYGTFDQGGNVQEWNESIISGTNRGERGGSCFLIGGASAIDLRTIDRFGGNDPTYENGGIGFRVSQLSQVPEPASLGVLGIGVVGMVMGRRRARR